VADSVKKTPTINNGIFKPLSPPFFCTEENTALVIANRFDLLQLQSLLSIAAKQTQFEHDFGL
jgi:hypothetical protein